jgi:hypothetical protein
MRHFLLDVLFNGATASSERVTGVEDVLRGVARLENLDGYIQPGTIYSSTNGTGQEATFRTDV